VGPATEAIEKSRWEALAAMTLRCEWCKMFRTLAACANSAIGRLGASNFRIPADNNDTAFLQLFTQIVEKVEAAVTNLNDIIEEECRELLSLAATRIFTNLLHADLSFDFATVLRRVEPSQAFKFLLGVNEHMESLLELYQRNKDGDSAEASSGTSGDTLDEDVADSGSSE
jgi:hypothetical protein